MSITLKEYINGIDIEDVMTAMLKWWPNEKCNIDNYHSVWKTLNEMEPIDSELSIGVTIETDEPKYDNSDECESWLCVDGIDANGQMWAIEFTKWSEWLGMTIHEETLSNPNLSKADIICAILWEMTFSGFDEETIQGKLDEINSAFDELKEEYEIQKIS